VTNQEAFTLAVKGIIAQGKPGYDADEAGCRYRAPDGSKCAVGMIIPDDQYSPNIEGAPIFALVKGGHCRPEWHAIPALAGLDVKLLRDLQAAHDDEYYHDDDEAFLDHFIKEARKIAAEYDLDASFIQSLPSPSQWGRQH
jgi:hypothetical protein